MNLNGWKRIWIVISIVYLIPVGIYAYNGMPNNLSSKYSFLKDSTWFLYGTESYSCYKESIEQCIETQKKLIIIANDSKESKNYGLDISRGNKIKLNNSYKEYKESISENFLSQMKHLLISFILWLLPVLFLLALGYAFRWIKNGFSVQKT